MYYISLDTSFVKFESSDSLREYTEWALCGVLNIRFISFIILLSIVNIPIYNTKYISLISNMTFNKVSLFE